MSSLTLLLLLANSPPGQTTLPRHPDPEPVEQREERPGTPTDPWFDRQLVATDDPAFIVSAVENARQGMRDARTAAERLQEPKLREAAQKIGAHNEQTAARLEKIARAKGWRLPETNPDRASTIERTTPTRQNADFIINQISFHENTVAQYRAQIAGKGDPELKRALRQSLTGYRDNLEMLLTLEP